MSDEPSGEFPPVPAEPAGLDEETAPPVDEPEIGGVPIKRSLNDLSAAEESQSVPIVQFAGKPERDTPAGTDTAPVSLDAVAQSNDSMRRPSPSSSFDAIVNPGSSGSYDQLNPASGSFDQLPPASQSSPYHMPQAQQREEEPQDDRPPLKPATRIMITLLVAIVSFVIVMFLCVSQWVPNHIALILMGGGMVLPTLLTGYFTSQRVDKNVAVRILPALIFGAVGMVGAFSWSQNHVRALAVPYAPARIKGMSQMLSDPSLEIALAACKRFTPRHTEPEWWPAMFEPLNKRPALALECVSKMPREAKTRIGGALADRWAGELVKGEAKDTGRACVIAKGVATLPIPPQEAGARLLQCALGNGDAEIQACCGEAMASMIEDEHDLATRLPAVVSTAKDQNLTSGVLAMSLHGQGLTEPQQKLAKGSGFESAEVRHMTLVLACESVRDEDSVSVPHLRAALDTHCKLPMDRMPKGSQWAKLCRNSLEKLKANPTADPMGVLCTLTTDKPIADAIAKAREIVRKAPPIITK